MQWCNDAMMQWCDDAMMKWYNDAMMQCCNDAMLQRCNDEMIQWCNDAMMQRCNDAVTVYRAMFDRKWHSKLGRAGVQASVSQVSDALCKYNFILRIKTKPVMAGANATISVYVWLLFPYTVGTLFDIWTRNQTFSVTSAPSVTALLYGFMRRFRLFLGQCSWNIFYFTM